MALVILDPVSNRGSFHLALGDLPTWLLIVGAVVAAGIALRQLWIQLDDSRRSTRQLERRLAEKVDITWRAEDILVLIARPGTFLPVGKAIVIVTNNSGRPIRNVTSRIELPMGGALGPEMLGVMTEMEPNQRLDYKMFEPRAGSRLPLLRPGFTYGFVFRYTIPEDDAQHSERRAVRPVIKFTDDPGLTWDLDDSLRLSKAVPDPTQWPWPWANRETYRHPDNCVRPQVP